MEREHARALARPAAAGARGGPRARPGAAARRSSSRSSPSEIADNIDQLLDPKLMVIRHMEAHPELANRVFEDVGKRELRLMINFGFVFGFLLGIPVIFIVEALPYWWVLPICGVVVGWTTNLLGHAADLRAGRAAQDRARSSCTACSCAASDEVADVYAGIIAEDIVTLGEHRRPPALRAALGPHPADARDGAAAGGRPRHRAGAARRCGSRWARASTTRSATRSPPRRSSTR